MAEEVTPELLTVPEVAELLRMTVKATYLAAERGQIPGLVKLGPRKLRFNRKTLRESLGLDGAKKG